MSSLSVEINAPDYQTAHRFPAWMALSVFSAVCVAAIETRKNDDDVGNEETAQNWSLAVAIISLILSFIAVVAYIATGLRAMFVGQLPEQVVLFVLTAFWAAGLPAIMNPSNEIATRNDDSAGITIKNANLYFFAWLAFAAVLYLTGSWAQEKVGYDVMQTPPHTARWYGLTASSVVVMGAAVRGLKSSNCNIEGESDTEHCKRTKFAIACGVVVLAAIMTFLQHKQQTTKLWVETAFTTVLLTLWCCGVGFITFGNAPGSTISNLYFATWISFILAVFLFATNFRQVIAARYQAHSPSNNENGGGGGGGGSSGHADAEAPVGNNPTVMSSTGGDEQHDF